MQLKIIQELSRNIKMFLTHVSPSYTQKTNRFLKMFNILIFYNLPISFTVFEFYYQKIKIEENSKFAYLENIYLADPDVQSIWV